MFDANGKAIRILFVEDNPGDARLMRVLLLEAHGIKPLKLIHVDRLSAAVEKLQTENFDVVLLDLSLPDSSGLGTLAAVQKFAPETAIVVMTGFDDPDFAINAVHAGAQDYLIKGEGDGVLIYRALRYSMERKRLERELIEAKKAAEEANLRKSRFLASMSHELRTPLNAILGFSEMIKGEYLGPVGVQKYAEYANDIFDAGSHLLNLINDVLDISKVEAGRFQLAEEEVDLAALLSSCLEMIAENARSRAVDLVADWPTTPPRLRGDGRLVKQVILNLLSNALKFTPAGGHISLAVHDEGEGGALEIAVSDNGCGIADNAIDTVMEEFRQADITVARDHGGTGLGLPLSRRFIALHGGSLTITSRLGEGTVVKARFPRERRLAPAL